MKRNRLTVTAAVLGVALLGPVGAAAGATTPSPTPSPEASGDTTPAANNAPVGVPDTATVVAGQAVAVKVLANDTDDDLPGTGPLTVDPVFDAGTAGSRAARADDGSGFTFTSTSADAGKTFTFSYRPNDGELSSAEPATVTVTVTAPPPVTRKVSITMADTPVALRSYTIRGGVRPRVGIDRVAVQRLSGTTWVSYKTDTTIPLASGTTTTGLWSVPFTTNVPKTYTFRAVAVWKDGKRAYTGKLTRTVVARADATVSGPLTRSSVPYSYRSGCPVGPSSLRRVTINRFTYDHKVARGSLVVRSSAVSDILTVFKASFAGRFPVRSMKPTDYYYAGGSRTPTQSDIKAMEADNTSAFNCRPVTGNPYRVSQHSYGNAIDINTVRNPYVVGSRVYPSWAGTYLNRSYVRTGMIIRSGVIASKMRQVGWPWGARWSHPDYQHFSSNGG